MTHPYQAPSVEAFLTSVEPDETDDQPDFDEGPAFGGYVGVIEGLPPDPMERIALSLDTIARVLVDQAIEGGPITGEQISKPVGGTPAYAELEDQLRSANEQYDDKVDELLVVTDVIYRIEAALGKSKAAPALAAKAVIDEWKHGPKEAPAEPVEEPEGPADAEQETEEILSDPEAMAAIAEAEAEQPTTEQPESEAGAATIQVTAPAVVPQQPAHDASVTDWRSYARKVTGVPIGQPSAFDTMNRSQVRTALGIEHNVPAQQTEGGA